MFYDQSKFVFLKILKSIWWSIHAQVIYFLLLVFFILSASNVWWSIKVCFLFVSYNTSFWLISFTEFPIFPLDVSYNIFAFIPKPLWLIFLVWIHIIFTIIMQYLLHKFNLWNNLISARLKQIDKFASLGNLVVQTSQIW